MKKARKEEWGPAGEMGKLEIMEERFSVFRHLDFIIGAKDAIVAL